MANLQPSPHGKPSPLGASFVGYAELLTHSSADVGSGSRAERTAGAVKPQGARLRVEALPAGSGNERPGSNGLMEKACERRNLLAALSLFDPSQHVALYIPGVKPDRHSIISCGCGEGETIPASVSRFAHVSISTPCRPCHHQAWEVSAPVSSAVRQPWLPS
jgi:hypothetical protein